MTTLEALKSLPVAERITLLEELWDSISDEPTATGLTSDQRAELDRRLDRLQRDPEASRDWSEIKSRLDPKKP